MLKKSIAIFLAIVISISSVFVACSNSKPTNEEETSKTVNGETVTDKKDDNKESTKKDKDSKDEETGTTAKVDPDGLDANVDNFIMDTVEVTDENGKTVTDKNGDPVTKDVVYKEVTNKNGDKVAVEIDDNGEEVTKPNGDVVTSKINTTAPVTKKDKTTTSKIPDIPDPMPENPVTSVKTEDPKQPTDANLTTIKPADDKVPLSTTKGTPVSFSQEDAVTVAQMLSVPYLYMSNYENAEGVPTDIAAHAAMWMASREGLNTSIFASGTIVLDLFKFFGQTVVNFKTKCNQENNSNYNIRYSSNNDTFTISAFDTYTHTIDNLAFYSLGNNNYYRVTGTVKAINGSDCKAKKVTAVIQKNKLDSSLGFSVKALQWS